MKTFYLLFLLSSALFTGCSSSYIARSIFHEPEPSSGDNYSSKNIIIYNADSVAAEYAVLSIRGDSAIVVIDPAEAEHPENISYTRAVLFKKDSIKRIIRKAHGGANPIIGGLTGLATGLLIAYTIRQGSPFDRSKDWSGNPLVDLMIPDPVWVGYPVLGWAAGALIGKALSIPIDLSLSSPEDRTTLKSLALFPYGEPAVMQYIK